MSDRPLTYEDLAAHFGVCERHVRRICKKIKLKPMDLGHRTKRFRPADLARAEAAATGEEKQARGWRPRA